MTAISSSLVPLRSVSHESIAVSDLEAEHSHRKIEHSHFLPNGSVELSGFFNPAKGMDPRAAILSSFREYLWPISASAGEVFKIAKKANEKADWYLKRWGYGYGLLALGSALATVGTFSSLIWDPTVDLGKNLAFAGLTAWAGNMALDEVAQLFTGVFPDEACNAMITAQNEAYGIKESLDQAALFFLDYYYRARMLNPALLGNPSLVFQHSLFAELIKKTSGNKEAISIRELAYSIQTSPMLKHLKDWLIGTGAEGQDLTSLLDATAQLIHLNKIPNTSENHRLESVYLTCVSQMVKLLNGARVSLPPEFFTQGISDLSRRFSKAITKEKIPPTATWNSYLHNGKLDCLEDINTCSASLRLARLKEYLVDLHKVPMPSSLLETFHQFRVSATRSKTYLSGVGFGYMVLSSVISTVGTAIASGSYVDPLAPTVIGASLVLVGNYLQGVCGLLFTGEYPLETAKSASHAQYALERYREIMNELAYSILGDSYSDLAKLDIESFKSFFEKKKEDGVRTILMNFQSIEARLRSLENDLQELLDYDEMPGCWTRLKKRYSWFQYFDNENKFTFEPAKVFSLLRAVIRHLHNPSETIQHEELDRMVRLKTSLFPPEKQAKWPIFGKPLTEGETMVDRLFNLTSVKDVEARMSRSLPSWDSAEFKRRIVMLPSTENSSLFLQHLIHWKTHSFLTQSQREGLIEFKEAAKRTQSLLHTKAHVIYMVYTFALAALGCSISYVGANNGTAGTMSALLLLGLLASAGNNRLTMLYAGIYPDVSTVQAKKVQNILNDLKESFDGAAKRFIDMTITGGLKPLVGGPAHTTPDLSLDYRFDLEDGFILAAKQLEQNLKEISRNFQNIGVDKSDVDRVLRLISSTTTYFVEGKLRRSDNSDVEARIRLRRSGRLQYASPGSLGAGTPYSISSSDHSAAIDLLTASSAYPDVQKFFQKLYPTSFLIAEESSPAPPHSRASGVSQNTGTSSSRALSGSQLGSGDHLLLGRSSSCAAPSPPVSSQAPPSPPLGMIVDDWSSESKVDGFHPRSRISGIWGEGVPLRGVSVPQGSSRVPSDGLMTSQSPPVFMIRPSSELSVFAPLATGRKLIDRDNPFPGSTAEAPRHRIVRA